MPLSRRRFTFQDKLSIIKDRESGMKLKAIGDKWDCSNAAVLYICNRKQHLQRRIRGGADPSTRFACNMNKYDDIDNFLWRWYNEARARLIPIVGLTLQEKALQFANASGNAEFKGSDGWLQRFKKRHGITFPKRSDKTACSVNENVIEEWFKTDVPDILSKFELQDIYNCDELGLLVQAISDKAIDAERESGRGCRNILKKRVTVLLCSNATGTDKLKPLVIGDVGKPRVLAQTLDNGELPVSWRANTSAWMTLPLFKEWLDQLNTRMRWKKKNICLLVDNSPYHGDVALSNVRLVFLPKYTTKRTQPMESGIVYSFKRCYRTMLLKDILSFTGAGKAVPQLREDKMVQFIHQAWMDVPTASITECFAKCDIKPANVDGLIVDDDDVAVVADNAELDQLLGALGYAASADECIRIDDNAPVCEGFDDDTWEQDLYDAVMREKESQTVTTTVDNDDDNISAGVGNLYDMDDSVIENSEAIAEPKKEEKEVSFETEEIAQQMNAMARSMKVHHPELFEQYEQVRLALVDKIWKSGALMKKNNNKNR